MSTLHSPITQSPSERYWRVSALTLTVLACLYISTAQVAGVDFWLQAKIGEMIMSDGTIPHTLLFPFTEIAEQHFNAHEWLSSVAFHVLLVVVGEEGLPLVTTLLGLTVFVLAFRFSLHRSEGRFDIALLGAVLTIATENYRHVLRPELFATILLLLFWTLLESLRHTPSRIRLCMATSLAVVWVNCHGSFILGPILATLYAVGNHLDDLRKQGSIRIQLSTTTHRLGALALLVWLATLVNPFGFEMLRFVVGFSSDPTLKTVIGEWMPTLSSRWLREPGWWIALVVWIGTAGIMYQRRRAVSAIEWLVFLMFSALAIKAIRFPLYIGLLAAYMVSGLSSSTTDTPRKRLLRYKGLTGVGLTTLVLVIPFGNAYGVKPYSYGIRRLGPEVLKTLDDPTVQGNVLTSMELGAELIFRAYPRLRPSIDCRIDSYGMAYYGYQLALLQQPALMQEFVQRYNVRFLFYESDRLLKAAKAGTWDERQWKLIAWDKNAAFLEYVGTASPH